MASPPLYIDQRQARRLPEVQPPTGYVPTLNPGLERSAPMAPHPGIGARPAVDYQRAQLAGGLLNSLIVDPSVQPFERLYRRLPEEGMFSAGVSPSRPFAFELGAFRVPDNMLLMLFDLRPDIYRFSGLDAGDFVPVEARRFGSIMGFQVTIDQRQQGNTAFELDPIAIQTTSLQAFAPTSTERGVAPQAAFNIAAASSFANTAGAGTGLLPQRPTRWGPLSVPFTLMARSGSVVQCRCVIFHPVPSPIAFIEYDIAGMLVPAQWGDEMLRAARPSYRPAQ
jgi:hypothetical protein